MEGTEYKDPVTVETADGSKEVSDPYTNYRVSVVENIKGELKTDSAIPLQKQGGVSQDNKSVVLFEEDVLPAQGETFVFLAYVQPNGDLLVSGPNSSVPVQGATSLMSANEVKQKVSKSDVVNEYEKAAKNQKKTKRERFSTDLEVKS